MDFLTKKLGPFPVWAWGLIAAAGVVIGVFVVPKFFGNQATSTNDPTATDAGTANAGLPSNIDPLTGVPYDIESQINPSTGLPAYYGGSGVTNGAAQSGITEQQYADLMNELGQINTNAANARHDASSATDAINAYAKANPPPKPTTKPPPHTLQHRNAGVMGR